MFRCNFLSAEQCQDWLRRISAVVRPPARLEELFAFAFLSCSGSVSPEDREVHDGICVQVTGRLFDRFLSLNWFTYLWTWRRTEPCVLALMSFQTCMTLFLLVDTKKMFMLLFFMQDECCSAQNDRKHHRTTTITKIK